MPQMTPNWSPKNTQDLQNVSKMVAQGSSGGSPKLSSSQTRWKSADLYETSLFTMFREGLSISKTMDFHYFLSPNGKKIKEIPNFSPIH